MILIHKLNNVTFYTRIYCQYVRDCLQQISYVVSIPLLNWNPKDWYQWIQIYLNNYYLKKNKESVSKCTAKPKQSTQVIFLCPRGTLFNIRKGKQRSLKYASGKPMWKDGWSQFYIEMSN